MTSDSDAQPGDSDAQPSGFLPPRWFIRAAWKTHKALYRWSGGRFGLRAPRADRYGLACLTTIGDAGFMIVDWYEGNMIYDFAQKRIWLFDWELCRKGEGFTLEMDSNYGSSRLMAPEEFIRGSWLDQRTIVFNLGRYALLTLPELADALAPVLARATYPARSERYPSIREFTHAFVRAIP